MAAGEKDLPLSPPAAEEPADLSAAESAEDVEQLLVAEFRPEATSLSSYHPAKLDVVELLVDELHLDVTSPSSYRQEKLDVDQLLVASPTAVVSSVVKSSADADDSLSYPLQTSLAAAVSPEAELKVEFVWLSASSTAADSSVAEQGALMCTVDQALESP